jgi:hypothetical protein
MTTDPIFIHAWWRSGSTYVWSKLREKDSCVAYYEPLHEKISYLTPEVVEGPGDIELSRAYRHPLQKKNYFAEYAKLIRTNDLHFSPELSFDRFLLLPEEKDENLRLYLKGLVHAALSAQRVAVLCFCRSQMRSAWMKNVFDGIHIALLRNPADQWASFDVDRYFRDKMLTIALKLRTRYPFAFAHIEAFEQFAQHISRRPSLPVEQLFQLFIKERDALAVFLVIWIASALQVVSYGDYILDIDLLSSDLSYRRATSAWFQALGLSIDFSDCASPSLGKLPVSVSEFDQMLQNAAAAIRNGAAPLIIREPDVIRKRLTTLSPLSSKFLRMTVG